MKHKKSAGFWNARVTSSKGNYGPGLVLNDEEIYFQRKHIVDGGDTLILGATPSLCHAALDLSKSVTSADYAHKVIANAKQIIEHPLKERISFIHADWLDFLANDSTQYDSIVTDGGLLCLEFPHVWKELVEQISGHLRPKGVFVAKTYVYVPELPNDTTKNPNLARFMTTPTSAADDWAVVPSLPEYTQHNVRYSLPPKDVVLRQFSRFTLLDELTPSYEEGHRFLSFAWQKPE